MDNIRLVLTFLGAPVGGAAAAAAYFYVFDSPIEQAVAFGMFVGVMAVVAGYLLEEG
jgi:hypothetical protein